MKLIIKGLSFLLVCLVLAIILVSPFGVASSTSANSLERGITTMQGVNSPLDQTMGDAQLITSNDNCVVFEINVPWTQLTLKTVKADGIDYLNPTLPGWVETTQPGAPAVPFITEQVGVPLGVNLKLKVTPGKTHIYDLSAPILPAVTAIISPEIHPKEDPSMQFPTLDYQIIEDPEATSGSLTYPKTLAEITNDGVVRQQRVVGIAVYPVQYLPETHQLSVVEYLQIELLFTQAESHLAQTKSRDSTFYEDFFSRTLINAQDALQWRQSPSEYPLINDADGDAPLPWAPPEPGWRINVREEGLYKLTYGDLYNAGLPDEPQDFSLDVDPSTLKLYYLGQEVAIHIDGEADGSFDQGDTLLFYGQGITSKYATDNIYWLTYGGQEGLRMGSRDGTPTVLPTTETPEYFQTQMHWEENNNYQSNTPGPDHLDRWLWDYIYPSEPNIQDSWQVNFTLHAPYDGPDDELATLTLSMLGFIYPHHVIVKLNGIQIGEIGGDEWQGTIWRELALEFPSGTLYSSPLENTLEVICPNDLGENADLIYIDWVNLDFPSAFSAENDVLKFSNDNAESESTTRLFDLTNFSIGDVNVYDISNPWQVVQIVGMEPSVSGPPFNVQFQDIIPPFSTTVYWAAGDGTILSPPGMEEDTPSILRSKANGADYIVITHQEFKGEAVRLSDHRTSQGLRTTVVDLQDIYDEFNYGIPEIEAIHDFLQFTFENWQAPAPTFVVLVGDGHYDPKDYKGYGKDNFIPPYLAFVDPWLGETAADNRFVTISGEDTMPDMMLGRLAVNTLEEASAFVNKIIDYETTSSPGNWKNQVLAVADNPDSGGNFPQTSEALLACCLPTPFTSEKVYYGTTHLTPTLARQAISDGINDGNLIVNYVGHSSVNFWADEQLFRKEDVANLSNSGKLPIILSMTCYDGFFHSISPTSASLAEVFTRTANKGAVASWSPTGLGVANGHDYLDRGFFQATFFDRVGTIGQAMLIGKNNLWATGNHLDLLDTYVLFGDPATHIARNLLQYYFPTFVK